MGTSRSLSHRGGRDRGQPASFRLRQAVRSRGRSRTSIYSSWSPRVSCSTFECRWQPGSPRPLGTSAATWCVPSLFDEPIPNGDRLGVVLAGMTDEDPCHRPGSLHQSLRAQRLRSDLTRHHCVVELPGRGGLGPRRRSWSGGAAQREQGQAEDPAIWRRSRARNQGHLETDHGLARAGFVRTAALVRAHERRRQPIAGASVSPTHRRPPLLKPFGVCRRRSPVLAHSRTDIACAMGRSVSQCWSSGRCRVGWIRLGRSSIEVNATLPRLRPIAAAAGVSSSSC